MFNTIKRSIKKLIPKSTKLKKRQVGSHTMYLDPTDEGISGVLMYLKKGTDREPAFMKVLRNEIKEGMTALDIGANIGYVSLIMAELVGPKGHVYCLEPSGRNFEILNKNIEVNDYSSFVEARHAGVSDREGKAQFHISSKSNLHSMTPTVHTDKTEEIDLITIDSFLKDKRSPNFIKMDIEGHEVEALNGMVEAMKKAPSPVKILMEVHPMYYSPDHSFEKSLRKMIDIGFKCKYVISAGVGRPDFFVEHGYEPDEIIDTGSFERGIYSNISDEHMIQAACYEHDQYLKEKDQHVKKIVRAIMIEK